jgi:hypothetical protein
MNQDLEGTLEDAWDWGRNRPPWVDKGSSGDGNFFGWNWISDQVGTDVLVVKADDATANLALSGDESAPRWRAGYGISALL